MPAIGNVLFTAGALRVEAMLGNGSPQVTQGGGGWQEVERGKRVSLTTWKGRAPLKITVPIMFDRFTEGEQGLSVEAEIKTMETIYGIDGDKEPPTLVMDSAGLIPYDAHGHPDKLWVIDGLDWDEPIRNGYGNRVRQEGVVTVLEYIKDELLKERSGAKRRASATKAGAKKKIYTVKKGDTLISIAKKQLGDADRWKEISKLNKNIQPRSLKPKMKLRLP